MPHLLGIDAGTSSVKAALFDAEHGIIAEASVDCSPGYTPDGFVELPMKRYWDSCVQCLDIIRHASEKGFNNVKAVSVSSQGMTFVPVDVNGCELGNAIVAYDNRAREEAERDQAFRSKKYFRCYRTAGEHILF